MACWISIARFAACIWLIAVALIARAPGLTINGYSNARDDRFASGYPNAPVANSSSTFIGAGYNWSGVGWLSTNDTHSFALLGRTIF